MIKQNKISPKIIIIPEGKICDYIDGEFRADTPEEYVRQNIEKRLVIEHGYEKEKIQIEKTIAVGSKKPRVDIVIYNKDSQDLSQEDISIIIECKKESIGPNLKKDGIGQLQSYMAACPNCEWGMWTNGKQKEVFRKIVNKKGKLEFVDYNDIPSSDCSVEDIDRPQRHTLKNAVEDNLLFVFKACHNHIYITDGLQKQPAFFEFLKVIFCKIEDERNIPKPLEFFSTSKEKTSPDGQLTVKNRISKIFERVKKKYSKIFDPNDEIKLKPRSLAYISSELQKYSFLNTHIDIKGKAYEELVGANLRGDRGEFFTPRNVMHMAVEMLSPKINEKILDPTCGTGGFLVISMNKVVSGLESQLIKEFKKSKDKWEYSQIKVYQEKIAEIAANYFFGFDLNPDLVKATKMNMVMNNDGSGNILQNDSLLPPHEWEDSFKTKIAEVLKIEKSSLTSHKSIDLFDLIITNPPFGSKIPIQDPHILEQFDLGHIWEKDKNLEGSWQITNRLQGSVPPEILFVERCLQFLKPGGRMGIVLPDAILGAPGLGYIRHWLIKNTRIIASVDLHVDTFQPRNGTQTSVLFLQKKQLKDIEHEEKDGVMKDYSIFMAMVDKVGHDKRGNSVFKRDKHGNEILVPDITEKSESKKKVIDDQTTDVPLVFSKWKKLEGLSW